MPVSSRTLLQWIALPVFIGWVTFSLWALLFGMTKTGALGLLLIPILLQPWLNVPIHRHWNWFGLLIPFTMWQVGWIEYKDNRIAYSCMVHQIYHTLHTDIPKWCPSQYRAPIDDWAPRTLYKPSQRMAIWFHHIGHIVWFKLDGNPIQAQQWTQLHFSQPAEEIGRALPPKQVRGLCNPTGPRGGTLIRRTSALLTQSQHWKTWYNSQADNIKKLAQWEQYQATLPRKLERDSTLVDQLLRAPAVISLSQTRLEKQWTLRQPILHSPTKSEQWSSPYTFRAVKIPIDTAMYCGLQMEGWLFPYREQWNWTESQGS